MFILSDDMPELVILNCPYGGSGKILLKIEEDGKIYGKCMLADMARKAYTLDLESYIPRRNKKIELGCPCPEEITYSPKYCQYNSGYWVEV